MPGGGTLTIDLSNMSLDETYAQQDEELVAGDYVVISISDTGTGMTKETVERALEPFFHDQGGRGGQRSRPKHGVRFRETIRRTYSDLQRIESWHFGESPSYKQFEELLELLMENEGREIPLG